MKLRQFTRPAVALCAAVFLMAAGESQAAYLSYSSLERTAGLGDATSVNVGTGNATAASVNAALPTGNPLDLWVERGSVAGGNAGPGTLTHQDLTVEVLTGSWGSGGPITGKWTINNPNYWVTYGHAAISLHVGDGNGDPDHWIWAIENGKTTGLWNYQDFDNRGGGLSNLKLYSHGTGTERKIPEGGPSLALLGLGVAGLGAARRFMSKKA